MTQYRLHIDIPLGTDENLAVNITERIVSDFLLTNDLFEDSVEENQHYFRSEYGVEQINYRLGHDEDRQKSNYLQKNENGHVTNKKIRITI